jgi:hypothetical protein
MTFILWRALRQDGVPPTEALTVYSRFTYGVSRVFTTSVLELPLDRPTNPSVQPAAAVHTPGNERLVSR